MYNIGLSEGEREELAYNKNRNLFEFSRERFVVNNRKLFGLDMTITLNADSDKFGLPAVT